MSFGHNNQPSSSVKTILIATTLLIIATAGITHSVVADVWLDAHYDSRLEYADDKVDAIKLIMENECLGGMRYTVYVFGDWYKDWIIKYSLPYAIVWHIASHGGFDSLGNNFLLTHYNELIYGQEIPDLTNVHEGGPMYLAFASACYSGHPRVWSRTYMLYQGFLDKGALAYMGYMYTVGDYEAFLFARWFYHYAAGDDGIIHTVGEAKTLAKYMVPAVKGNIQLYGASNIVIVDGYYFVNTCVKGA